MNDVTVKEGWDLRWHELEDVVEPSWGAMLVRWGPTMTRDVRVEGMRAPRDRGGWQQLAERVEWGELVVLESHSLLPGFCRDEEGRSWVVRPGVREPDRGILQSLLRWVEPPGSGWQRLVGAGKELVNRLARENAAALSEHLGGRARLADGRQLTVAETAELFRREGADLLPPSNALQAEGAAAVAALPAVEAIVSVVQALGTRGRSVVRDPKGFARDMRSAMNRRQQGDTEVLGNLGGIEAVRRRRHAREPRHPGRYQGPDDLTRGPEKELAEWEFKGTHGGRAYPARNKSGERQGSAAKNLRRANIMVDNKSRKVGQPSSRQGGPYTREEIELWREIKKRKGKKDHYFVHTDASTGRVRVYRQDHEGRIVEKVDDFQMEGFEAAKAVLREFRGK